MAEVACPDGAIGSAARPPGATPRRLEVRDHVGQALLVPRNPSQARFGVARAALRRGQTPRPLALQVAQPLLLERSLLSGALDVALKAHEIPALPTYAIAKLLDTLDERAIAECKEMQIFVSRHELAERLRSQQGFDRMQRPPLVDVDQVGHGASRA